MEQAGPISDAAMVFFTIVGFAALWLFLEAAKSMSEKTLGALAIMVCVILAVIALAGVPLPDPPGGHIVRERIEQQRQYAGR